MNSPSNVKDCDARPDPNPRYPTSRPEPVNAAGAVVDLLEWELAWHEWTNEFMADLEVELETHPGKLGAVVRHLNFWGDARHKAICHLLRAVNNVPEPALTGGDVPPIVTGSTKPPPPPFGGGIAGDDS